jgi:general secretion pathway protein F
MIAVGEEANNLEKVLVGIADTTERRTTRQIDLMVRLLEPILLLFMAGITLVVIAAILLPVFRMSSLM